MSKVWFITGAGSGIGAGTARAALKVGNRVVATGRIVIQGAGNALKDVRIRGRSNTMETFRSRLDVSRIGLGAMSMSGYYNIGAGSDAESFAPSTGRWIWPSTPSTMPATACSATSRS